MVYGFRYPPMVAEDGPLRGEGNPYCETKIESERAAQAKHEPGRFEVTVIRPGDVYGPRSIPWVVRPYLLMKAGLFLLPNGGKGMLNPVYVDDLVDGVLLSIERDASSTFTVTDGAASTCMDYFRPIAAVAGSGAIRTAPAGLLRVASRAAQVGARLLGRDSPAAPSVVDYLTRPHAYSIEKAKRELGYRPAVPLDEGMRRVCEWLAREPPVTAK
jgi:nucleoside-diphosphate-sugar epimerase